MSHAKKFKYSLSKIFYLVKYEWLASSFQIAVSFTPIEQKLKTSNLNELFHVMNASLSLLKNSCASFSCYMFDYFPITGKLLIFFVE